MLTNSTVRILVHSIVMKICSPPPDTLMKGLQVVGSKKAGSGGNARAVKELRCKSAYLFFLEDKRPTVKGAITLDNPSYQSRNKSVCQTFDSRLNVIRFISTAIMVRLPCCQQLCVLLVCVIH